MMKSNTFTLRLASRVLPLILSAGLISPAYCYAEYFSFDDIQSLSVRMRISEQTVLGKDAPEDFREIDVSANIGLPWNQYSTSEWGYGTRLMTSAGVLRGVGKNALVVSLIPELTLGSKDGRYVLDLGAGGALFSRYEFGEQDYGGPFQFALTMGITVPIYKNWGLAYRFLHYSDAAVNGPDTVGADFHMLELSHRL